MNNRDSNWHIPADWLWHLGTFIVLPCIALLAGIALPLLAHLKAAELGSLYGLGVVAGSAGILLMFSARLPLYRQNHFWTVGARHLDRAHRALYWLAYTMVAISVLIFWIVWLRIR